MDIWKELADEGVDKGLLEEMQAFRAAHPAPEEDESGVLQLVEWREEAPYG